MPMSHNASLLHISVNTIGALGLDDITGYAGVSHPHMTDSTHAAPVGASAIAAATMRVCPSVLLEPCLYLWRCGTHHNDEER